jgi:hypothetical protein
VSEVSLKLLDFTETENARKLFSDCRRRLLDREWSRDIVESLGDSGEATLEPLLWSSFLAGWRAKEQA